MKKFCAYSFNNILVSVIAKQYRLGTGDCEGKKEIAGAERTSKQR